MRNGEIVADASIEDYENMFVKLSSEAKKIDKFCENRQTYFEQDYMNIKQSMVLNNFTYQDKKIAKENNIDIMPVKANEACKILCNFDTEDIYG